MSEHRVLLDAFADARRTWDELVGLQPDVMAGSGNLKQADLVELERRVDAHRGAIDTLADALETEPPDASIGGQPLQAIGDPQTSHKAGSRSIAQKEAESRYPDRSMPASHKVAGAFGK